VPDVSDYVRVRFGRSAAKVSHHATKFSARDTYHSAAAPLESGPFSGSVISVHTYTRGLSDNRLLGFLTDRKCDYTSSSSLRTELVLSLA
jgi:hypothetical protein